MGAREELFRRVAGSFVDEDKANKLIDDLLHEAAEKIRDEAQKYQDHPHEHTGMLRAADLIDW